MAIAKAVRFASQPYSAASVRLNLQLDRATSRCFPNRKRHALSENAPFG
jgi:hypothetical protein